VPLLAGGTPAHRPAYGSDGDYFSKPNRESIFAEVYALNARGDAAQLPGVVVSGRPARKPAGVPPGGRPRLGAIRVLGPSASWAIRVLGLSASWGRPRLRAIRVLGHPRRAAIRVSPGCPPRLGPSASWQRHEDVPLLAGGTPAHRPAYGSDGDYFSKPNRESFFADVCALMREAMPRKYPALW